MSTRRTDPSTSWEVWRTHLKGGPDVLLYSRLVRESQAREILEECQADEDLHGYCTFHLVRVEHTRTEVSA